MTDCICFLGVPCSFLYRSSGSPDIPGVKSLIRSLDRKPAGIRMLTTWINNHWFIFTPACTHLAGTSLITRMPSATNPNLHPHHSISHLKTVILMYSQWNFIGLLSCFPPINYSLYCKLIPCPCRMQVHICLWNIIFSAFLIDIVRREGIQI